MWTILVLALEAEAGPWVKDAGQAYVKAGYSRFAAGEYVDPTLGDSVSGGTTASTPPEYVGHTHHLYAEVGLPGPLQAVVNLPFIGSRNTLGETVYVNRAFGDADVGLAAGHTFGSWPVSLTLSAKLPLYDNAELGAYGYLAGRFPAIGDGQVDLQAMAAVGRGFAIGSFRGWGAVEAGYRHRTEWWLGDSSAPDRALLDGIPWRAQLGWSPQWRDRELGWVSLEGSGLQGLAHNASTKEWAQVGGGLGARLAQGLALEAGGAWLPWARSSSTGWSVSGGVSWQR